MVSIFKMAAILKSTGGHFALRNKKFKFLDPISCLKFSIIIISRLKETKYSENDFCYNEFFKMAAILKSGLHFESENIKFGFLDPKNPRNVLLHDHLQQ